MRSSFDPARLSKDEALSFELFNAQAERADRLFAYRDHGYVFDQMNGAQSQLPAFLINIHRVANVGEAEAYIERIRGLGPLLDTLPAQSAERAAKGYAPPKWVYAYVISDIRNLLKPDNAVIEDIGAKVGKLDIDAAEIEKLFGEQYKGKEKLLDSNVKALHLGRDYAKQHLGGIGLKVRRANAVGERIFVDGNSAAALGCVYGGATVCAWYPITPSSSLAEAFQSYCQKLRVDPESRRFRVAVATNTSAAPATLAARNAIMPPWVRIMRAPPCCGRAARSA